MSIIIPTYNQRADFLRLAIQSALIQGCDGVEIIVSDNHSTNETTMVLAEFSGNDIKVIRPPVHLELLENFAFAAEHASGEYLCFLSSDDKLADTAIQRLLIAARMHPETVAIYGDWLKINEQGEIIGQSPHTAYTDSSTEILAHLQFLENISIGALIKASAYRAVGGFKGENFRIYYSGDVYLGLKLLAVGPALHVAGNTMLVQTWSVDGRKGRWAKLAADEVNILSYVASSQQLLAKLPENLGFDEVVRRYHFRRMIALSSKALWEGLMSRQQYAQLWTRFCKLLPRTSALFAGIVWNFPLGGISSGVAYLSYRVLKIVR
ncbi:MAG: glycosyltransferase [Methylophilaceae bacterium]